MGSEFAEEDKIVNCQNSDSQYDKDSTTYTDSMLRSLSFEVFNEVSVDSKHPQPAGSASILDRDYSIEENDGHISRMMNLIHSFSFMMAPHFFNINIKLSESKESLSIKFQSGGCFDIETVFVKWRNSYEQRGNDGFWANTNKVSIKAGDGFLKNPFIVHEAVISGWNKGVPLSFQLSITCDTDWNIIEPDSSSSVKIDNQPISNLVRSRLGVAKTLISNKNYILPSTLVTTLEMHEFVPEYSPKYIYDFSDNKQISFLDKSHQLEVYFYDTSASIKGFLIWSENLESSDKSGYTLYLEGSDIKNSTELNVFKRGFYYHEKFVWEKAPKSNHLLTLVTKDSQGMWRSDSPIDDIDIFGQVIRIIGDDKKEYDGAITVKQPRNCLVKSKDCIALPLRTYGMASFGANSTERLVILITQEESKVLIYPQQNSNLIYN